MIAALVMSLALAAIPSGFYESRVLEPAASYVAGKPVRVYCTVTASDFNAWAAEQSGGFVFARGYTVFGANQTQLSSSVCAPLRQQLRRRKVDLYELSGALTALVHESIHMRGVRDEGKTECRAMHETPRVAVKFFHVRPGKQLRALMAQAWQFHRNVLPPDYQTVC